MRSGSRFHSGTTILVSNLILIWILVWLHCSFEPYRLVPISCIMVDSSSLFMPERPLAVLNDAIRSPYVCERPRENTPRSWSLLFYLCDQVLVASMYCFRSSIVTLTSAAERHHRLRAVFARLLMNVRKSVGYSADFWGVPLGMSAGVSCALQP